MKDFNSVDNVYGAIDRGRVSELGSRDEQTKYIKNIIDPDNTGSYQAGPLSGGSTDDFVNNYLNGLSPQEQLAGQQRTGAQNFRSNLPNLQNQLAKQMADQNFSQMNQAVKTNQRNLYSRGVGYGGMAQGQNQGIKNQFQSNLGSGLSSLNQGLNNAADQMDTSAIQTGMSIQSSQQQLQNQAYARAVADMNSNNQAVASGLGLLGTGAALYYGGAFK